MKKWFIISVALVALTASAARLFVASSSMWAFSGSLPSAPIPEPLTMAAWYRPTTTNGNTIIFCATTNEASGVTGRRLIAVIGASGFSGQLYADATDVGTRLIGPSVSPGVWIHVAAVFVSNTERYLYLNGSPVATNTTAPATAFSCNRLLVGARWDGSAYGQFADGRVAEACLWKVALSAGQISSLAAGKDPRTVSSTAPVVYWPMFGEFSPETPYVSALTLTLSNSPAKADHPPITRP